MSNDNKDKVLPEVWVTKYALTNGIERKENVKIGQFGHARIEGWYIPIEQNYWHTTEAAAIAHAKQMRDKKIASLKKQIEKLEQLNF